VLPQDKLATLNSTKAIAMSLNIGYST